ncbi:C-type lectin domain family 14 member A [Carettochelys insculpta]|uniref:C-type lectin domain family 14 member A n=1 Tax=Carettochelys insculpta TaxID=44489 RepID=UPI003EBE0E3C
MRGAIPLCLLLLQALCGAEPRAGNHTWCGASGTCYSVHLAQVPFDRAQADCAARGGALTTAGAGAEVLTILELLSAVAAQPGSWLFWLGLVRRAQQCTQTDRPLRGFSWLLDSQQGEAEELDKWVKEPSRSCTRQRCAALQVTAGQPGLEPWGWQERPCRDPTGQGFVCKYHYNGTCPAPTPQGARSLLYALPYRLHSAALDSSPPGTELRVSCAGSAGGDARLVCELGPGGYGWTGAEEELCPCPSGYRSASTGACLEPGDCTSAQGAFLCLCARGFLLGPDKRSCAPPGHLGTSATAVHGPSRPAGGAVLLPGSSAAPSRPPPSHAGNGKFSSSSTYVFILVATAVVTVVVLVGAVLGVFRLCFTTSPSPAGKEPEPAPATAESDPEANSTESSSEHSLEARGDGAEGFQP